MLTFRSGRAGQRDLDERSSFVESAACSKDARRPWRNERADVALPADLLPFRDLGPDLQDLVPPSVPATLRLDPTLFVPFLKGHGVGTQNYICKPTGPATVG